MGNICMVPIRLDDGWDLSPGEGGTTNHGVDTLIFRQVRTPSDPRGEGPGRQLLTGNLPQPHGKMSQQGCPIAEQV
ncbi:hypothetical protein J1614_003592 [Plenodomus biglobosus]|nr:hypothetical protein J1614_003592 [Plenodomus biglobosus]